MKVPNILIKWVPWTRSKYSKIIKLVENRNIQDLQWCHFNDSVDDILNLSHLSSLKQYIVLYPKNAKTNRFEELKGTSNSQVVNKKVNKLWNQKVPQVDIKYQIVYFPLLYQVVVRNDMSTSNSQEIQL